MTDKTAKPGELLSRFPEINFSNYGQQEVEALQAWALEAFDALSATLSPAHVEDERAACERWIRQQLGMPARIPMDWDGPFNRYTWAAWSARAALSAPPAAVPVKLTNVRCMCGDEYPHDSYGAGFIAGSGMCENCDAAIPAKEPPAAGVPEGWKLAPLKPTIEMVEAGYEASLGQPDRSAHARVIEQYDAMLAEAPTPPASEQQPHECTCVYATAKNTAAVRNGSEMGGYLKAECVACQQRRQSRPASEQQRDEADLLNMIDQHRIELLPEYDAGYTAIAYCAQTEPIAKAVAMTARAALEELTKKLQSAAPSQENDR
ncbi:hypothetical protein [Pseudomonas sp. ENNP23]|uniref:hypothetical protein n=1 Tax=Pseudomonas sp. ENNP23 TaxID=1535636 RepID=UPI00084B3902|nr:hypothetical protein [Pseudomonas sp. ENNP23]OEC59482.1 hypothetical protein A9G05_11245 [Pseudomonas sp. ENNP23]